MAGVEKHTRFHFEALRFETPCAKLPSEPHHSIQMRLHFIIVGELIAGKDAHGSSEQFGARLANQRSHARCGIPILARLPSLIEIEAAETHHPPICDLDSA